MPAIDVAIVGAGPAGVAAAAQCVRQGDSVALFDRTGRPGGLVWNAFSVENYPGLEPLPGPALAELLGLHLQRFGVDVTRAEVTGIELLGSGFVLRGPNVSARAVIAAVGTVPHRLSIRGAAALEGSRVHEEVRAFLSAPRSGAGQALIIGGGEAALDYALTLARAGWAATVLVRGTRLRARGRLVGLVQAEPAIRLQYNAEPLAVCDPGHGVEVEVSISGNTARFLADGLLVAIGRGPATADLISGIDAGLSASVSTPLPGLFVAGDARAGGLGQMGIAVGDGLAAAQAVHAYLERGTSC